MLKRYLIIIFLLIPGMSFSQTTNSRTQSGAGVPITATSCNGGKTCLDVNAYIVNPPVGYATETTLALIKTAIDAIKIDVDKIPASPAQEAGNLATIVTRLTSILAQLDVALSTRAVESGGNLATIAGKDFATQTTLALMKTALDSVKVDVDKIPASPAQEAGNLATIVTRLTSILAQLDVALSTRAVESGGNLATIAGKDFATQTTLALIKAKTDNIDVALSTRAPGVLTLAATGQQSVTASAAALPSNTAKVVCISVLVAGTQIVYFGPSGVATTTGQEVLQGATKCRPVSNSNQIYIIAGSTGSTVAYEIYQ